MKSVFLGGGRRFYVNNNNNDNNNDDNNDNKTYIASISILLFSSALKNKNISKKKDCIKYTKCINLPKRVKTIMSTLKL